MSKEICHREILRVTNVSLSFKTMYYNIAAVKNANFSLHKGEAIAIVGESGCGKSALVKSIMGLNTKETTQIDSGEIWYKHKNLLKMKEDEMRQYRGDEIGMIFQDPMASLNPTMRVGKQILESYLLYHPNATYNEAYDHIISLLQLIGIPNPEKRYQLYPHELSGGMRQRIMIAISLAASPNILIADEPTTALDVTIQAQILSQLKKIQKQMGMSIIFITHNLSLVAGFCSRILVMYNGTIVESAPTEVLFKDPKHPYTQKLIASIPSIHLTKKDKLTPIEGHPPSPIETISGCSFHPRCPFATKECTKVAPLMKSYNESQVACYHPHSKIEKPAKAPCLEGGLHE